jgi:hypothetical protein
MVWTGPNTMPNRSPGDFSANSSWTPFDVNLHRLAALIRV